jgi:glycerate kinase
MATGWADTAPWDVPNLVPLSDGGPGFLDVLANALEGDTLALTVRDPIGRDTPAQILVVDDNGRRTVYLESAQAAGLHLLGAAERDPAVTTTFGVGQLLAACLDERVDRIVVGLGGSATNDGGAGLLAALGAGPAEALDRGGLALRDLSDDVLAGLADVRTRFGAVELVVATDVDNPLLGLQGASATFAPQKGASPQLAQDLEGALGRFTEVVGRTLPAPRDLLTGSALRLDRMPGAGAAGGLGYALLLLGGTRRSGVEEVLAAVGFDERLADADLVVTGEGRFDWSSLHGKVVSGVAEAAAAHALPVLVLAGETLVGRRETMALGVSGSYAVASTPDDVAASMADPVGTLRSLAQRVARTWSPPRA